MKKKLIIAIAGLIVLIAAAFLVYDNYDIFDGKRVKNPDCYSIEFDVMNQKDTHSMDLVEGDTLVVDYLIRSGRLDLKITGENDEAIYTGNDMDAGVFELEITNDGTYTINVNAKHASGFVNINQVKQKN